MYVKVFVCFYNKALRRTVFKVLLIALGEAAGGRPTHRRLLVDEAARQLRVQVWQREEGDKLEAQKAEAFMSSNLVIALNAPSAGVSSSWSSFCYSHDRMINCRFLDSLSFIVKECQSLTLAKLS